MLKLGMFVYKKAYKFRIYPNVAQSILICKTLGCVRFVWNIWTEVFNSPKGVAKIFKTPKELRQEYLWLQEVPFNALQQKERDFREFRKQYFNKNRKKKINLPKFKSRKSRQTCRLTNKDITVRQDENKVRLAKIGWVKTVFARSIPDGVKLINAIISKDKVGDYFISIVVEETIKEKEKTNKSIGIDVGLTHFATLSDGKKFQNPRYFYESQVKITKMQKQLVRKVLGSNRWEKCRKQLARVYRKVYRQQEFFLHNLSTYLVSNFDVIAIEDLNVLGLLKNHSLAKAIFAVSWYKFFKQLQYKCRWYGKTLLKAPRFEPTSKTCHICGYYKKDMSLADRTWTCPHCGTELDRDVNAAINILNKAVGTNAELQIPRVSKPKLVRISKALLDDVSKVA